MSRRVLLAGAAAALAVAVLLAVSGGVRFTVGGFRVSARSSMPPALAGMAMLAAWAWLASRRGEAAGDLTAIWPAVERRAWTMVVCVAAVSAGMAIGFGTFAAAGADASGYLSQAAMWAAGSLAVPDSLPLLAGWPADAGITAPLGWNASLERGWQVPTYGPGLPLLMSLPFTISGPLAACLVVAVSAALATLAAGAIAFRLAGGPAGAIAALALATSPVFIYQSIQPMSDVPVTAAWGLCWAAFIRQPALGNRQPVVAGIATALAVLIRPNLAPLAIVPLAFVWRTANSEKRTAASLAFAIPVAAAGLFLGWLQWTWYGSPFRSGYGTVEQLYSFSYVWLNLSRYGWWAVSTSPVLVFALAGLWASRGFTTWMLAAFAGLNLAAYLVYFTFSEWPYLRFLLPAIAIAAVFVGVAVGALLQRSPAAARAGLMLAVALAIGSVGVARARALGSFQLTDGHRRILQIDRYLDSALPPHAVVIAGEQSGAVRFDTGRSIVRWEAATREDLASALRVLEAVRRPVWILLDSWEEPLVRAKFGGIDAAALDWPPAVDAGETQRTRAWNLTDRARYLNGARIMTDRLR